MENLSILNSPFASCMKWFFSRLAVACTAKKNTHSKCTMCLCLIDWIEILHSMNCTERNIAKRYKLPSAKPMQWRDAAIFDSFFYVVIIHAEWNYERVSLRKAATVWLPSLLLGNDQSRRQSLFQPPLVIVSILFSCFFLVVPQAEQTMNKLDKATD